VPYLGTSPTVGLVTKLNDIASGFNGVTTTFQLAIPPGGVTNYFTPGTVNALFVRLGSVTQNPGVEYTINGSQIIFTTAPTAGLTCFIIAIGQAINIGVPSDGSVSQSKLGTLTSLALTVATPVTIPSTGIYSPSANQLAISTSGTQKFTIDSLDGNPIIDNQFPTIAPTLDLAFALTKQLDPRITFSRASSGTYFDANGVLQSAATNFARFDHNPATGESLGLLVEEARTNLLTYSEQFDDAAWSKTVGGNTSTISANFSTAPDGTSTADKIVTTVNNAVHGVLRPSLITVTSGTTYNVSVYAKAAGWSRIGIRAGTSALDLRCTVNLSTGAVVNNTAGTATVKSLPNSWYHISIAGIATSTGLEFVIEAHNTTSVQQNETGDGTSGILVWGAQVEAGSFSTSYIPTVAATVTRSADLASMTGTNFSSWYNQSQGTIFALVRTVTPASVSNGFLQLTDGTVNNRIEIQQAGSGDAFPRVAGIYRYLNSTTGSFLNQETGWNTDGVTVDNWAFGYNSSGFTLRTKFDSTPSTGSGTFPQNLTNFSIGHKGTISRLAYYPVRLLDTQLQALTAT
jgi:hypothetical protein